LTADIFSVSAVREFSKDVLVIYVERRPICTNMRIRTIVANHVLMLRIFMAYSFQRG